MFTLPIEDYLLSFGERELALQYQTLSHNSKTIVINYWMEARIVSKNQNPPLNTIFFKIEARRIVSLLCSILGYKSNEEVYETMLGFLSQL